MDNLVGFGASIIAEGLPRGSFAYNAFNGSHVSIVCADGSWNWWPENSAFGVMAIIIGL